jgi:hypothetical protein
MGEDIAKRRERQRRYDASHREQNRAKWRRWAARNPEQQNERVAKWKQENPEKAAAILKRNQIKRRAFIEKIKTDGECMDCGGSAEDFHHRDPATKRVEVGRMTRYSEASILAEVEKCDLLCADCHRKRHR